MFDFCFYSLSWRNRIISMVCKLRFLDLSGQNNSMCKGLKVRKNTEYWGNEKKQEYLEHRHKSKVGNDITGEVTMSGRASEAVVKGLNLILSQWCALEE